MLWIIGKYVINRILKLQMIPASTHNWKSTFSDICLGVDSTFKLILHSFNIVSAGIYYG
jgi:hypothetical protein